VTKLEPLSIQMVNWALFRKLVGEGPVKAVDAAEIPLDDPAAFVSCLKFNNRPFETLEDKGSDIFRHSFLTCIGCLKTEEITDFIFENPDLRRIVHGQIIIVSGTLYDWIRAILDGCYESSSSSNRRIMNDLFERLNNSHLKRCFQCYERVYLQDDTFILRFRK